MYKADTAVFCLVSASAGHLCLPVKMKVLMHSYWIDICLQMESWISPKWKSVMQESTSALPPMTWAQHMDLLCCRCCPNKWQLYQQVTSCPNQRTQTLMVSYTDEPRVRGCIRIMLLHKKRVVHVFCYRMCVCTYVPFFFPWPTFFTDCVQWVISPEVWWESVIVTVVLLEPACQNP